MYTHIYTYVCINIHIHLATRRARPAVWRCPISMPRPSTPRTLQSWGGRTAYRCVCVYICLQAIELEFVPCCTIPCLVVRYAC